MNPKPQPPRRLLLTLSAFVCPGAGQCLQGRWIAGVFFGLGCVVSSLAFLLLTLGPLFYNFTLRTLQEEAPRMEPLPYDATRIRLSLAVAVLLYVWNVADIYWRTRPPPANRPNA